MRYPSNFEDSLKELRDRVQKRLNYEADNIIKEEVEKILGRVKIIKSTDLKDLTYDWFIEAESKEKKK